MTSYTIRLIAEITHGQLHTGYESANLISSLLTDSRKLVHPEQSLFFAIKGDRNDGHVYIADLIQHGVKNFVVSDVQFINDKANFILVQDALEALQQLAAYHRKQFSIPVIGITGSNGKTIVKEWLYQLMRENYHIVRSPKSYNSQVGVPLSVWQMGNEDTLALFEAGISMPGEMQKLEGVIQPTVGLITNIGQAHDEHFQSWQEKASEKLLLFENCKTIIYCKDYPVISEGINQIGDIAGKKLFTWSKKQKADLQIGRIAQENGETSIQGIYNNDFLSIKIPFSDEASIENAIHCWAVLLLLKLDNEIIKSRMEMLSPVAMRLEMKEGINNCSIINDSYNSDLGSLTIALDFLNQQKQHIKKTLILSDILQSGKNETQLYQVVAGLIERKKINRLIGIGSSISHQASLFSIQKSFYHSTDEFLKNFSAHDFTDETILLKGARTFGFERISKILQQKTHETVLEINLNAIIHNLNYYRSRLKPETKIMAMVKAFTYGSGSFELANLLQFHRVDYLAVAYTDEGIELRKAGINLPVMVMNPEIQSFESMIQYKLEPEIYSFRTLSHFSETLKRYAQQAPIENFPVHLKFDTGMHRLGFEENDISELIIRIRNNKFLKIKSVFSHLAASDESAHDQFTKSQFNQFIKMCQPLIDHFNYPIMRHILNSSGIIRFPETQLDLVRIGIGLHGIGPTPAEQKHLQLAATLKTTISQIKTVREGETVGYSRKGVAKKDMQIATVGIGYADGFRRSMGNHKGKMMVNGKPAPVVGNVCMDMCMLDITDIPAQEGDEVIVFGAEYPVTAFAKDAETIPYEVLTNISQRVKRIYFHE